MRSPACWLALLAMPAFASASAEPAMSTLTLHYQDRPPYSYLAPSGEVEGLVATPAAQALRAAGIAFRWQLTPAQRQLALIQSGGGLHCGVGWFRSPERETKGRFSAALYRDRPFAALVRQESTITDGRSLQELLLHTHYRLLVKEGYSYGATVDTQIQRAANAPLRTGVEPRQMARMVAAGRADWMIVAPEEAETLSQPGLRMAVLADMPDGPARHLYCSRDVPADWLQRVDAGLAPTR